MLSYPELKPHQQKALAQLANGKILCGGVGSGKTHTSLAYYVANESPRRLIVITTAMKRDSFDWQKTAHEFGIDAEVSFHGKLTVDSWNNISKYINVEDAFFIFDEQRVVGSGKWAKHFRQITRKNRWILLSATPGDTWMDYVPVFLANGFYKNRSEFIQEHVIYSRFSKYPKIDRYVGVGKLVRLRNHLLVQMPYERHTKRHIHFIEPSFDSDLLKEVMKTRWNPYTDEPMVDAAELWRVMRRIVNSDPSRATTVEKLLEQHPRLIVFYNFDYELEQLREAFGTSTKTVGQSDETTPEASCEISGSLSSKDSSEDWEMYRSRVLSTTDPLEVFRGSSLECPFPGTSTSDSPKTLAWSDKTSSTTSFDGPTALTPSFESTPGSTPDSSGPSHGTTRSSAGTRLSSGLSNGSETLVGQFPTTAATSESKRFDESESGNGQSDQHGSTDVGGTTSVKTEANRSSESTRPQPVHVAEWNGHRHDPVPTTERWVYLVQYTAGAEGWNCITTDSMVFYSLSYSYRSFEQGQGRIDRLDTKYTDLHYFVFRSKSTVDSAIFAKLLTKRDFNEAKAAKKLWDAAA